MLTWYSTDLLLHGAICANIPSRRPRRQYATCTSGARRLHHDIWCRNMMLNSVPPSPPLAILSATSTSSYLRYQTLLVYYADMAEPFLDDHDRPKIRLSRDQAVQGSWLVNPPDPVYSQTPFSTPKVRLSFPVFLPFWCLKEAYRESDLPPTSCSYSLPPHSSHRLP